MAKLDLTAILVFSVAFAVAIATEESVKTEETLKTEVLKAPPADCPRKAKNDDIVYLQYVGKFINGTVFDDSKTHTPKEPFEFKLGHEQVIAGWDQGIVGMCVGEQRKLTVPPSLGYGSEGYHESIPANATLIFEIELVDIKDDDGSFDDGLDTREGHSHAYGHDFDDMDTNNDTQVSKEELTIFLTKLSKDGKEKIEDVAKTVEEMIKEHDTNKDGMISFEENQHFAEHHEEEHHDEAHPEEHHAEEHHDEAHPAEPHAEEHHAEEPHPEEHHEEHHEEAHPDDHHEEDEEHEEL